MGRGLEVGGAEAELAAGRGGVEPGPVEQVDPPVGGAELGGHVRGAVDIDDAGGGTLRSEDGEVATRVLDGLEVDARPVAGQGSDELTDEGVALEPADAGDHREPRVEVER